MRVMVVDDSNTIRRTMARILNSSGCTVLTAVDGFDALSKIPSFAPNLIFIDIVMPRLDGYQTCALVKNSVDFKQTPVVMLSSKCGLFDRAKGKVVGSDQYITKPFSKDEVLAVYNQYTA